MKVWRTLKEGIIVILIFLVAVFASFTITTLIRGGIQIRADANVDLGGMGTDYAQAEEMLAELPIEVDGRTVKKPGALFPEDCFECHPYVVNTGKTECYVFMKIDLHSVAVDNIMLRDGWEFNTDYVPAIIYEINDPWVLVEESLSEDGIQRIYAYSDPLEPGDITVPLCDYAQVTGVSNITFTEMNDDSLQVNVDCGAVPTKGFDEFTVQERWNSVREHGY